MLPVKCILQVIVIIVLYIINKVTQHNYDVAKISMSSHAKLANRTVSTLSMYEYLKEISMLQRCLEKMFTFLIRLFFVSEFCDNSEDFNMDSTIDAHYMCT